MKRQVPLTRISEQNLTPLVIDALTQSSFTKSAGYWIKVNLFSMSTPDEVSAKLYELKTQFASDQPLLPIIDRWIQALISTERAEQTAEIEERLWPVMILDKKVPNFIVPIRASWAATLLDERLARQYLFGTEARLILNFVNVYYRSRLNTGGIKAPCRILWYVSKHPTVGAEGQIRACSLGIEEVLTLPAREAYRQFRRMGTYEWSNVVNIAGGDPDGLVMAIRFHLTEQFENPIPYRQACQIVDNCDGRRPVLRAPAHISQEAFAALYGRGRRIG